jgi:hypothetical protein
LSGRQDDLHNRSKELLMRSPLVFTAAALATAALAVLVPGALAGQSVSDPTGDAGTAPDISAVSVLDDPGGDITISVATNQPELAADALLVAFFDTDSNATTGDPVRGLGADYFIIASADGAFLAEVGAKMTIVHLSSSASSRFSAGTMTIRVNRSDLGDADRFAFLIEADESDANGNTIAADFAPDGPPYPSYHLSTGTALTLAVGQPKVANGDPVAGRPFVVSAPVTRSDGADFGSGVVSCKSKVGQTPLRARASAVAGVARCSMTPPRSSKGKILRGSMTASMPGAQPVTRRFAFKIH